MNKEKENVQEFSILDIWHTFINYITFISLTTFAFVVLGFVYAWYIATPMYISKADVMIQVEQDSSSGNDTNFDLVDAFRLIDTVAELMEKEIILENSISKLDSIGYNNVNINDLRNGLIVNSSPTSYFINISFIHADPNFSQEATNLIIDAVIEETDIIDAFPVLTNKIRRTSYASDPVYYAPNKLVYLAISFISGIVIALSIVILKETFSQRFKDKEEIESTLKLQVLGVIPKISSKEVSNAIKKK